MFPQFKETWPAVFRSAVELKERVLSSAPAGELARVVIDTDDPQAFCAAFVALCRENLELFFFNPRWGELERREAMAIASPDWVVESWASGAFAARRLSSRTGSPGRGVGFRAMIPTGGTSGRIRFAAHDWSTLAASAYGFQQYLEANRIASHCVLPLYHVSGFMQLIRSLLSVGTIVFGNVEQFDASHEVLAAVERRNRYLSLVATQLERLTRFESTRSKLLEYDAIFIGGGPASIGLLERCREWKLPLAPTYGMTETAAQVATMRPSAFLAGAEGVGQALPHVRIDIVSEEDGETRVEDGERGRIRISASSLFKGYYGERAPHAAAIVTTDLGAFGPGRNLQVYGRSDNVIISGGEKIHLREVELCLEHTGLLQDVVAFGVEDREWGQKLVAAYVTKDDFVTEALLREAIQGQLADFKKPKLWLKLGDIPRNEAGKALLPELMRLV